MSLGTCSLRVENALHKSERILNPTEICIVSDLCQVKQLFSTRGIYVFITIELDKRISFDSKGNKYFPRAQNALSLITDIIKGRSLKKTLLRLVICNMSRKKC